jgi:hypothetical protein
MAKYFQLVFPTRIFKSYLQLAIACTSFDFTRVEYAIANDASLNRFHVLRANVTAATATAACPYFFTSDLPVGLFCDSPA